MRLRKNRIAIFASCLTFVLLCWATTGLAEPPKPPQNALKIGVILPLSGPGTYYGTEVQRGMMLCQGEQEFIFEDSQTRPAVGVSTFQSLLLAQRLKLAVTAFSPISKAILPVAKQNQVPVLVTLASSSAITRDAGDQVARYFTDEQQEGPLLADYAFGLLGAKTAAIFYLEDEFGLSYASVFEREFVQLGGKIVGKQSFIRDQSDFRTQILRIEATKPDIALVIGLNDHIQIILNQSRQVRTKFKWLTNWSGPDFSDFSRKPDLYEGLRLLAPLFYIAPSALAESFLRDYREAYRDEAGAYAAIGCDIAGLIRQASGRGALISGLRTVAGFDGIMGKLTANHFGEISFPVKAAIIKAGKVVEVNPLEVREPVLRAPR